MKNVLVLYHGQSLYTPTVKEYVEAFGKFSRHAVHYLHADWRSEPMCDFHDYDVVMLHYSCRLCYLELMSPTVRQRLREYRGLKVAFVQDEYQETGKLRAAILELGLGLVFTVVPRDKISWVYPPEMFPGVEFVPVLTGYVPERYLHLPRHELPRLETRPNWLGYRGRNINYCWGDLAYYKLEIGKRFKSACQKRGVPHDIAWADEARIYQDRWYSFVLSCRAMPGVPSGSNVFDFDGRIHGEFPELIKTRPDLTYEEYRPRIAHKEAEIDMGQIAPRMFEAAALGTAMVLLEGGYSGVLRAGHDYIEVKRDFSNLDDVLDQIADVRHLQAMTERAYENVIASGKWSYRALIDVVDGAVDAAWDRVSRSERRVDALSFSPLKSHDQGVLEEFAVDTAAQYPTSRCLDLSHLRRQEPNHASLAAALGDRFAPPLPAAKELMKLAIKRTLGPPLALCLGRPRFERIKAFVRAGVDSLRKAFGNRAKRPDETAHATQPNREISTTKVANGRLAA